MAVAPSSRTWVSVWLLPGAVLCGGGLLSLVLAWMLQRTVQTMAHERAVHRIDTLVQGLEHSVNSYGEIVKGLQARFSVKPYLSRQEFDATMVEMDVPRRYPGLRALTFTRILAPTELAHFEASLRADGQVARQDLRIRFAADRSEYAVVDYVWPLRGNAALAGLDVYLQPESLSSLLQSRATGKVSMTAPFTLLQDDKDPTGVLIRAPVFVTPAGQGEPVFQGAVNISLQTRELLLHALDAVQLDGVAVTVEDLGRADQQPGGENLRRTIYRTPNWEVSNATLAPVLRDIAVHDRIWRVQLLPRSALLSQVESAHPWLMGAGGLGASALLALLVALLARQRQQARQEVEHTQSALQESMDRFHDLFHHCGMGVSKVCSETGRLLQVNQRYCEILGFSEKELLRTNVLELSAHEDVDDTRRLLSELRQGLISNYLQSKRMRRSDGQLIWVEVAASPLLDGQQELLGQHISVVQDVSERRQLQAALEQREARLSAMLQALPVGMLMVDAQQRILSINDRFTALTGYGPQDLQTLDDWWKVIQPDASQRQTSRAWVESARREAMVQGVMPCCELAVHCKDGKIRALELSGSPVQSDFVFTLMDLSQRKQAEEKIRNLALFDMLTQLPNRRQLLERVHDALQHCPRQNSAGALLLLDIDNFKTLNETQGHDQGDALLLQVAQRLSHCLAQGPHTGYTLARQGGDEFAVVLENLPADPLQAAQQTEKLGRRMMEALREPFILGTAPCHVTVSMGATTFHGTGETVEELLKRADLAMYEAKSAGRNALHFFDPSMQSAIRARAEMEADLRNAIEQSQFDLYYQPQVMHEQVVGAEALLRWRHPVKGFISPALFIPLAEDNGMVLQLGRWVLHTACRQLAQWAQRPGLAELALSVNVSPLQFQQPQFVQDVEQALASHGVRPDRLKLELTEGMLLSDVEDTIRKMEQLRGLGVAFSLDDFGTGYSSLSYLKRLPLEQLKIDQSFVREVLTNANDQAIAKTIVALASSLGLRVIAEGVETAAQRDFLDANGCHAWQGYLFSPAVPVAQFEAWVAQFSEVGHSAIA